MAACRAGAPGHAGAVQGLEPQLPPIPSPPVAEARGCRRARRPERTWGSLREPAGSGAPAIFRPGHIAVTSLAPPRSALSRSVNSIVLGIIHFSVDVGVRRGVPANSISCQE